VAVLREILQFEDGGENCVFFEILSDVMGLRMAVAWGVAVVVWL
jgi:hypothetical protein